MSCEPSAAWEQCSSCEFSHSSIMDDLKSEITPRVSSATISASAAHNGHQACKELRPLRTSKVSVSIVILVFFAIVPHITHSWTERRILPQERLKCPYKHHEKL